MYLGITRGGFLHIQHINRAPTMDQLILKLKCVTEPQKQLVM